jgi:hypothetical protein
MAALQEFGADLDSAHIDPRRLARALAVRGKEWSDLTRGQHRLNATTVTKLRRGQHVRASTVLKLGSWLKDTPIDPQLDAIVARPFEDVA